MVCPCHRPKKTNRIYSIRDCFWNCRPCDLVSVYGSFYRLFKRAMDLDRIFIKTLYCFINLPVFEELFIRGYILKFAYQWNVNRQNNKLDSPLNKTLDHNSINNVKPGAWSLMAIGISTIAFTAGHMPVQWLAAVAYSILISILWIIRKDLLSCMVAHGITNFTLALYVYFTGQWGLW